MNMNIINYIPDIFIALIVLWSMVRGYTQGLAYTLVHATGWVLAAALGFAFTPKLQEWLTNETGLYTMIREKLLMKFTDSAADMTETFNSLPAVLAEGIGDLKDMVTSSLATRAADIVFTILCFIMIILVVKLVLGLLVLLVSKKNRKGMTGAVDGVLGAVGGFVTGVIMVYIMLALMAPLTAIADPNITEALNNAIDHSSLTKEMYDNNIIMLIFKDFLT